MKWILYTLLFGWLSGFSLSGYNLPHVKQYSDGELTQLARQLPEGLNYRLYGGEESYYYSFEHDRDFVERTARFIDRVSGTATVVVPRDYRSKGTIEVVYALQQAGVPIKYIQYENEEFSNTEIRGWRDWWDIRFNTERYYRRLAARHLSELRAMASDFEAHGIDCSGRLVFNIPLHIHENKGFRAYAEQVRDDGSVRIVDVHVYGKPREADFAYRLHRNLEWITTASDWQVVCFEFNELWHYGAQRLDLHLIDSDTGRDMYVLVTSLMSQFGIDEQLYFTLATNSVSQSWQNFPVFSRYDCTADTCLDLRYHTIEP